VEPRLYGAKELTGDPRPDWGEGWGEGANRLVIAVSLRQTK
jgi:hypothetical protein